MKESWDKLIARAEQLTAKSEGAKELLVFYAHLLRAQKEIYECLRSRKNWLPTGVLEDDLYVLRGMLPELLRVAQKHGTPSLIEMAEELSKDHNHEITRL